MHPYATSSRRVSAPIWSQVGFTTDPVDDRSTMYTSDIGAVA